MRVFDVIQQLKIRKYRSQTLVPSCVAGSPTALSFRIMAKELLYLLGSITSSFLTTSILSIPLAVRSVLLLLSTPFRDRGSFSPSSERRASCWFYEGRVRHVRRRPVHHAFEYPARYALVDLDLCAAQPEPPFSLTNHLSAAEARRAAGTDGPVLLLTIPTSVGYEQNPLSVYYCYDKEDDGDDRGEEDEGKVGSICKGRLSRCIAEVTNTPWGERASFVFSPGSDLVVKPLHVSPFMDMLGNWNMLFDAPGESLSLAISIQHPTLGSYFTATLRAKRVTHASSVLGTSLYFWLMPQKVAIWIYWQAAKLWWKKVSFVDHPKYARPTYRQDAVLRECALNSRRNERTDSINSGIKGARWCIWRDAPWPWS